MVTPDYARAYIDEMHRVAHRRRITSSRPAAARHGVGRPSGLARLLRRRAA